MFFVVMFFFRHTEVQGGKHGEDIGLQRSDQQFQQG